MFEVLFCCSGEYPKRMNGVNSSLTPLEILEKRVSQFTKEKLSGFDLVGRSYRIVTGAAIGAIIGSFFGLHACGIGAAIGALAGIAYYQLFDRSVKGETTPKTQ